MAEQEFQHAIGDKVRNINAGRVGVVRGQYRYHDRPNQFLVLFEGELEEKWQYADDIEAADA